MDDPTAEATAEQAPQDVLVEHLPRIEKIAAGVARRYGLTGADVDDFRQEVQVKLVEDDYRRIREFRGGSRLTTYLTTVIVRLAKDYCNHLWGKWRASAAAKRLGWEARLLERLLYREHFSFEEAAEKMRRDFHVRTPVEELAELAGRLPQRTSRRFEGEEALEHAATSDRVDRRVTDAEKAKTAEQVETALQEALAELPAEDQVLLKLHFRRGWTLARVARFLKLDQKPLYRRRDRSLQQLREAMEQRGLDAQQVRRLLGWERLDLRLADGEKDEL